MSSPQQHCVILTMDCLDDFEVYDHLIDEPLQKLGWQTHTISWKAENVDWNKYDAVVIRSPWDYQDHADAFLKVLSNIEASSAHLENSLSIIEWNIDKIYLKALEEIRINIVPTLWENEISVASVNRFFNYFNTDQLVIKPRISANADNTFWLTKNNIENHLAELTAIFKNESFMVQPFMESVIKEGEFSLFYFNGTLSHTILKTPKNNDFRVQEEHGGRLTTVEPEAELLTQAENTLAAIAKIHNMPLYARLDYVRDQTSFALMEAELIEPSLYFNMDPESPTRFAQAFVDKMNTHNAS
ncbi:ATP-grasp domain-containing protein [Colwellia sp. RE-S-Sl-9]